MANTVHTPMYETIGIEDRMMYMNPNNAHGTMEEIFGSEESQVTIEGKYQHVLNYDKTFEKLMNMAFLL